MPLTTSVISRVQAFLPQLEASNTLLAQRMKENPTSVDIEHISEGMDQYIEMVRSWFVYYLNDSNLNAELGPWSF